MKKILACLGLGAAVFLGCEKPQDGHGLWIQFEKGNEVAVPKTKQELMAFVQSDIDRRILAEALRLQPWDILYTEYKLESILELFLANRFTEETFSLIEYPFMSHHGISPFKIVSAKVYCEMKGIPLDTFHVRMIRDERHKTSAPRSNDERYYDRRYWSDTGKAFGEPFRRTDSTRR